MYSQIVSGNRIYSASKDPAGLVISEKLMSQIKGNKKGIQNINSSQNLLKIADSSLNNILEELRRTRELAVQAGNGTYFADGKSIIQNEINCLFKNIQSNIQNTTFNTKN